MDKELFWCNSHERPATVVENGKRRCDPTLGGILLPCFVVDLTGQAELVDHTQNSHNEANAQSDGKPLRAINQ